MLKLHKQRRRVINFDETWLSKTSHTRQTWAARDGSGNIMKNSVSPRVSMIAALDTEGNVWFTLAHSNSDSNTMALFLRSLSDALDIESPNWQDNTVLLWDNAPYHTSNESLQVF